MTLASSNWIRTNLPKRDELSLRTVLALPKASRRGFMPSTLWATPAGSSEVASEATAAVSSARRGEARYFMMTFMASVLPAPLSPEMTMLWSDGRRSAGAASAR